MLPRENTGQKESFASPDHLRVGLYIYVDLPWFRHPFTLNSFKISSEDQIHQLRALKKPRFRYSATLSDSHAGGSPAMVPIDSEAAAAQSVVTREKVPVEALAESDPRVQQLRDYRQAVTRTEKAFVKAVGVVRRLNKNLHSEPADTLQELGGLVDQMVSVFLERPEVTLQVMGESCGGDEVYHHGLNVSVLCMMLAKGLALTSEDARALGTGAMLHDIGLVDTPDHILRKSLDELTAPERTLRARHVDYGKQNGLRLGLAPETLTIIEQHHELADGTGYPRGLSLQQIAPLARVVSLVNAYDNLCNPVNYAQAMTPHEALAYIFARRKNKYDAHVLQLMIRSLGVYPPGSIVKLSDESIAIVVSVNPHRPLRPWVMLHNAAIPRENAALLNLESEVDINISKSIRPAVLPPGVYAYLSPRKRITYFFDGGLPLAEGKQ